MIFQRGEGSITTIKAILLLLIHCKNEITSISRRSRLCLPTFAETHTRQEHSMLLQSEVEGGGQASSGAGISFLSKFNFTKVD